MDLRSIEKPTLLSLNLQFCRKSKVTGIFVFGCNSIFVTVNYEGVICPSAGSPPSLPRPSHHPPWASDGEEPALHFSIRLDVSLIMETEILPYVCSS